MNMKMQRQQQNIHLGQINIKREILFKKRKRSKEAWALVKFAPKAQW